MIRVTGEKQKSEIAYAIQKYNKQNYGWLQKCNF